MEGAKPMKIPMHAFNPLSKDISRLVDETIYRDMIGSLLYLTASRHDIMYNVCLCVRFKSDPQESHLKDVKRILH